jgi:hypothetical protein
MNGAQPLRERLLEVKREALLAAAEEYAEQSAGGEHPLMAGARLRLAAKEWARARKESQA